MTFVQKWKVFVDWKRWEKKNKTGVFKDNNNGQFIKGD